MNCGSPVGAAGTVSAVVAWSGDAAWGWSCAICSVVTAPAVATAAPSNMMRDSSESNVPPMGERGEVPFPFPVAGRRFFRAALPAVFFLLRSMLMARY